MRHDIETIRVALRARCAEVAEALLGRPTYRSRSEFRWGRRGSLALGRRRARRPVASATKPERAATFSRW
jgi:hypothetical protein